MAIAKSLLASQHIQLQQINRYQSTPITHEKRLFFLQELQQCLEADMSISQTIEIIAQSQKYLYVQCQQLLQLLQLGHSLADSLRQVNLFSQHHTELIAIGEQSGSLTGVISNIIASMQQSQQLRRQLHKALFYPSLVLAITVIVMLLLLIVIVPKFANIYQQLSTDIPTVTTILLSLSSLLTEHSLICFWCLLTFFIFAVIAGKYCRQHCLDRLFSCPVIKTFILEKLIAEQFFLLHCCLQAGMTLPQAITIFKPCVIYQTYQQQLDIVLQQLQAGTAFSQCFNHPLFPSRIHQWLEIAEHTGQLAHCSKTISDYYSNKLMQRSERISLLIEPFIMIVLGLSIGGIVIAMYLPMFQIGLAM